MFNLDHCIENNIFSFLFDNIFNLHRNKIHKLMEKMIKIQQTKIIVCVSRIKYIIYIFCIMFCSGLLCDISHGFLIIVQ